MSNYKRAEVAIQTIDKIDFRTKDVNKERDTFYKDEKVNSIGRYDDYKHTQAPNNRVQKYMKQKLKEYRRKIDNSKIIVGDSNTATLNNRKAKQKISKM